MFTSPVDDALVLTGADLQALHEAQLALLSPSHTGSSGLNRCSKAVSRLLGTPHAAACLRHHGAWHIGASCSSFGSHLPPALTALPGRSALSLGAFPHTLCVRTQAPHGEGLICAAFSTPSEAYFGPAGRARLALLVPALQSRVQQALGADALLAAIETLGEPLAVYGADGHALCQSSAFSRRLRDEPEADRIYAEAQRIAARLGTHPPGPAPARAAGQPAVVRTARARYELHGSRIPRHLLAQPAALIHLRVARSPVPSKARLHRRYGLTEREVEVALLVSEGLTSKEIAQRLNVSTNTVRRHGEKVLEKLGLHTRAGIAMALMRED